MPSSPPVILTIAGSDSCAGAGLQADLKAITANGGYGICAVTAIVSEVPHVVSRVQIVEPEILADQLSILSGNYPIAAIKTGMLANSELSRITADFLEAQVTNRISLVVDPVMVATSGDRLLDDAAVEIYRQRILPLASIATPNLAEAGTLLDRKIESEKDMTEAAADFVAAFGCATLLKGGHLSEDQDAIDIFASNEETVRLTAPRIPGIDAHGTGCTLSAAIATLLGDGQTFSDSVRIAKNYISAAIEQAHHWRELADIRALNHQPDGLHSQT
ncbi:UNVERIFIED_CONTAM: hypothetical protein GTU68_024468 [Idotea baltica]|nr:hypothetical protein [Idotea baltica]